MYSEILASILGKIIFGQILLKKPEKDLLENSEWILI